MGKNIEKNKKLLLDTRTSLESYIIWSLYCTGTARHCDQLCQSGISDRQQLLESAQTGILQRTDCLWYDMCNLIGWY